MQQVHSRNFLTSKDLIPAALLLLAGLLLSLSSQEGNTVEIRCKDFSASYKLNKNRVVELSEGEIQVMINNRTVSVSKSNCPKKICTKGSIYRPGQVLICVPNRLAVRISGHKEIVDAVTQ